MQTILHLTDIHFGWEGENTSGLADRKVCLDGILTELEKLEVPWKPTIICLTGDIAWRGSKSDYVEAKKWLDELLRVCGLTYGQLIVCAGNHDVIRSKAEKLPRPESTENADKVLSPPIADHTQEPFAEFATYCKEAGMPALKFGDCESYLVGSRTINNLQFIVFNSAWFSKDNEDKGKLWVGLPHLKYMEAKGQCPLLEPNHCDPQTVALLHHPAEWLHSNEQHASGLRPNTLDYLAHRCHLLLTGHTHGEVRGADRIADRALHFTGGSAYAGASHFNSFRLIQISADKVTDRAFEFDPRLPKNNWKPRPAESRPLTYREHLERVSATTTTTISTKEFRDLFRKDAAKHLERKSRLLRQIGSLPATISRPVSVRISLQREQYDSDGRLLRPKNAEQAMPFYDAVRESRRTLLLGDLGTGKSTLAAKLVIETIDRSDSAIAILIPAKVLQCSGQLTQRDLLNKINDYVANDIWLKTPKFDLPSILEQGIEVLLVIDGLDELSRDIAARLLNCAAAFVDSWPTIQVVSTARPVELVGVSYADWRVVHTVDLDDAAKIDFIRQELIADGIPADQLTEKAATLLHSLKEMTSLDSIANSPLVIRLIYPRLITISSSASTTLGELLYDLLLERLDGWQKRDDKPSAYSLIEQALPAPEQKAEFLAVLADKAVTGKRIGHDEAKALLEEKAATIPGINSQQFAVEALSFYEWLGLIAKTETVEFPLQPLAEICAAVGYFGNWRSNPDVHLPNRALWRVVSFVAAISRRRGQLETVRKPLTTYVDYLLKEEGYLPAACYIVVETVDTALALHSVQQMDNVGYRPLTYFHDERIASARNIAKTLVLAGETGFDWFYQDYLDPKYPIPNAGSAVIHEIFAEWAALVRPTLTPAQKEKLSKMVLPYEATGEGHFFGVLTILSVLVPDTLSVESRLWYQSLALDSRLFTNWVKEQFLLAKARKNSAQILDAILLCRSSGSSHAARLWLNGHPDVEPPYSIIRMAFRCASKLDAAADETEILTDCRRRLGEDKWLRFARWAIIGEESPVAAGAAKVLFDAGERRLSVLGNVLMKAMHDGGYIATAEKILSALVLHEGDFGIHWLASRVAEADEWHGAYSGWWRVLLERIDTITDGPMLLASCVRNLGPFTLPRYPEVREGFARLLNGPNGKRFLQALRLQLASLDPDARQGAASILITCDPRNEVDALFVAIQSRAKTHEFDLAEWESFCLTLDFGPSVLISLKSKLGFLEPHSRALALVVLEKGNIEVEPGYRTELMTTLSSLGNWHLSREPIGQAILGAESSFAILLEQLDRPKSDAAQRAAERLLEFHRARLTPKDEAKCIALRHGSRSWTWELAAMMRRAVKEPGFTRNLLEASKDIAEKGGRIPLLGVVAQAVADKAKWKDVVWLLLCDDTRIGGSSESEDGGMALLEFGFLSEEYRESIGQAAKEYLADPRVKQNRWHEAYHWLALLADEFVSLDKEIIRTVILHGKPIAYSATSALIARLGEIPKGFSCDRGGLHKPTTFSEYIPRDRDVPKLIQLLNDYGRDSDELHPSLLATLHECIFLPTLDEAALKSISSAGIPGILISTTLRFIYGMSPRMEETIPLLDRQFRILADERMRRYWAQLTEAWKIFRESAFVDNPASAKDYLAALDEALLNSEVWKLAVAYDILELRHFLTEAQIPTVFTAYADHLSNMHEALFVSICKWLSGSITETTKNVVVQSAENAIVTLNESSWLPKSGQPSNVWAFLLFPAILWANSNRSSEASEIVFLRGVRSIAEELQNPHNFPKPNFLYLLSRLDPLLAKAPPDTLGKVVRRGIESLEPSVSAFCRLIDGFSKHCKRA